MEVGILGPLEVVVDGRRLPLPGAKPRALLATLALAAGEAVSAERLIDELWGDDPPETAANALQVHVSQLRRVLGADAVRRRPPGYELAVPPEAVDLVRFERLVEAARAAEPDRAARLLREALTLWRGDPEVDRPRLEELRLAALEDRIEADLALGRHGELVPEVEALVAQQPLRERLRGQLMLALYRAGRQADALEVYRATRAELVEQLGIEPSPALQQLERRILAHAPELDVPEAKRDERLQALPAAPNPLVGRARELAQAIELLRGAGTRLVTFTGPGGIGKTRLALEVARASAAEFAGGAAFVSLAGVADPALIASAIAQALELRLRPGDSAEDELAAALADRELLLLVDNFEQLLEGAPVLSRLLAAAPGLKLLVTTRALLRLAGEHEFQVPPLEAAEELFRARAHGLAARGADEEAIRAICARLEGLPLAIELAAARVRLLPPPELLRRLESRLDVLTSGTRDAPERQRTMRAAIEWSYRLLDPDEQLLFARLGIFVRGAELDAIEHVCGEVATLDALESLVDKSLLRQSGTERPRFTMLEVLREFALEQLDPLGAASDGGKAAVARPEKRSHLRRPLGEYDTLRVRHTECFVDLVEQAEDPLTGPDQRRWLERLETEHANLRAAIARAQRAGDAAAAVRLAAGLRRFWFVHGHAEEGLRTLEAVLELPGEVPPIARNKALNGAAMLAAERGDYAAARKFLERSVELAEALGDPHRLGVATSNLGNLALYEERWEDAERLYERAIELYSGISARDQGIALENLGLAVAGAGDLERATGLLEEAIAVGERTGSLREAASARVALAWVSIERGETERAWELLAIAHATFVGLADRGKTAECIEACAGVAAAEGRAEQAARLLGAADALRDSVGSVRQPDQDRWVRRLTARLAAELDDFDAARATGRATDPSQLAEALPRGSAVGATVPPGR